MKTLLIMLTILTFTASLALALQEPEDSLILYQSFDTVDGKNTIDHSKYENHGEIKGNPKSVNGKFGKALEFNGSSDWIEIPHEEILTVEKEVTVMAWIHTERHQGPGGARWQGILSKSNNPRSYSFYTESPSECLHLSAGGGSVCEGKVELNEWQHVVGQVDNGTHRYWINGKSVGEYGGKNALPGAADTSVVYIGTTGEGASRLFLGMIDEVRIWNRALTEEEVIEQMEKGHFELFPVDPRHKVATTWGTLKTQK